MSHIELFSVLCFGLSWFVNHEIEISPDTGSAGMKDQILYEWLMFLYFLDKIVVLYCCYECPSARCGGYSHSVIGHSLQVFSNQMAL